LIIENFITPNKFSRPQSPIIPWYIVLHWTNSPRTSAHNIRNYFDSLKSQVDNEKAVYASAHVAVDDKDIVYIIPPTEMAYNCGSLTYSGTKEELFGTAYPNAYTVSIELCHRDKSGVFSETTLLHAKLVCVNWCNCFNLVPKKHIIRHYDVTGKLCPKYMVDNPDALNNFKNDVERMIITGRRSV